MSEKEYFIELHLKEINEKLDRIDKRLDKLEEHINFINSVYSDLKNPINIAKKFSDNPNASLVGWIRATVF